MLSTRRHAVKKGWLHKRGQSCISRWKPKWAVLYDQPTVALYIYDKRDHPHPKYIIRPDTVRVIRMEEVERGVLENRRDASFVLSSRSRKFYLSAPSVTEREEWMLCLAQYSNPNVLQSLLSAAPVSTKEHDYSRRRQSSTSAASSFKINDNTADFDYDDGASVYSAASIRSYGSVSSRASGASRRSRASTRQATTAVKSKKFSSSESSTQELLELAGFQRLEFNGINILDADDALQLLAGRDRTLRKSVALTPMDPWDEHYQRAFMAMKDDGLALENNLKLSELVGDFQELAQALGKKIIDNYHIKDKHAGDTFVYGDIMFHFAANYEENSNAASTESMEKKAANELRAIRAVNQQRSGIHTALMCLVDYKGFRLIAYAAMPLDPQKTLAFSLSALGPKQRQQWCDKDAMRQLNLLGQKMNLKSHAVATATGHGSIDIAFSSSLEAHHASSRGSTFYALNLCDMFPVDIGDGGANKPYCRLRPEFVRDYQKPLSSDATVVADGRMTLDAAAVRDAGQYLRRQVIPAFVKKLDSLELLPIDSRGLTQELHKHGINVRHLGLLHKLTRLPYIREMCTLEMVARAWKSIYREKMRLAILHFRQVSASSIQDELEMYTVQLFQSMLGARDARLKFWNESLQAAVQSKFDVQLTADAFLSLHQPALFLSLQYHGGVEFHDSTAYDFTQAECVTCDDFIGFTVLSRCPDIWLAEEIMAKMPEERRLVYGLARQLLMTGPSKRLTSKSTTVSMALNSLAKLAITTDRHHLAVLYSTLALRLAPENHAAYGLIYSTLMESEQCSAAARHGGIDPIHSLVGQFKHARDTVEFHWGVDHPLLMTIYDKMALLMSRSQRHQKAYEYLECSMELAFRVLGRSHPVSAGYLTKAGYMLLALHKTDEALGMFREALQLFQQLWPNSEAAAENHFCIAEALLDSGDVQQALDNATQAMRIRERLSAGAISGKTVDSYQQMGKMLSAPYAGSATTDDTHGSAVSTAAMQRDLQQSILYYEKVFRYMKMKSAGSGQKPKDSMSILLTLTRTAVALKLRLLPARHKEVVRRIREHQQSGETAVDESCAKEVVLKLVHLTPSVFMDELFQRLDDDSARDRREDALAELAAVLQISESRQMCLT